MRKLLLTAALAAVAATGLSTAPAFAKTATLDELAARECAEERREDRGEFRRDYGGTGAAAMRRCVRDQKADARRDCREELREERAEFVRDYGGTGAAALQRCVRDELR